MFKNRSVIEVMIMVFTFVVGFMIVGLSVLPIAFEMLRARRNNRRDARYDAPQERRRVEREQIES